MGTQTEQISPFAMPSPHIWNDLRAKSGVRVVCVLEFFHAINRPARAIEIGRALGMAPSSVNDLLKTLVEVGYLEFNEGSKTYFPGLRAALFAHWLSELNPNLPRMQDFARNLSEDSGETVVLFAHQEHQVQVISVSQGTAMPPENIVEGAKLPVFGTAAGAAVMMNKNCDEIYNIARRTFRSKACSKAAVAMGDIVHGFKARGYASSMRDDIVPDNWVIAMPLPLRVGQKAMVVGIGGPIDRVRSHERELAELAHRAISRFFGAPAPAQLIS